MPREQMPHTQTSAPVDDAEVEDVREQREASTDEKDAGEPRIPTGNMDEDIGE